MFHTHPAGSECLCSTCGSLRHSGGSSVGEIQRECFHIAPAASPAPAPWGFGNFVITNSLFSPPLGEVWVFPLLSRMDIQIVVTQFGKPMGWFSSLHSPLPKAHVPSLGKHLQFQLQDSRLRGLCVTPVLPYSIVPSRKYPDRKPNCLETAEIN